MLGGCALVLVGCGSGAATPELYGVLVDFFKPATTCYVNMMAPNSVVTTGAPTETQFEVWDGPDARAVLLLDQGGRQIDMGDAPDVQFNGALEGAHGSGGWAFTLDRVTETTAMVGGSMTKVTDTTKATVTFERGSTFKGTLALNSIRACEGTGCPATSPSCSLAGIAIRGTRLAVTYQRPP